MMYIFNYENLVDPLLRDIRRFLPEFSAMKYGDKVLDICCGTGEQVLEYGRQGITATGIDIDPSMLKIAVKNKKKRHLGNVSFQLADATALPFPDAYFDSASISFGLHDKGKRVRDRVIQEMKRVVKPNGDFTFLDFQVPLPKNTGALLVRMIEFVVGGEHYAGFKDYLSNGGLAEILKTHHLLEQQKIVLKAGTILALKATHS